MTPGRFSEKLGNGKMRKIDGKMLVKDKGSVQMYIMVFVGDTPVNSTVECLNFEITWQNALWPCSQLF